MSSIYHRFLSLLGGWRHLFSLLSIALVMVLGFFLIDVSLRGFGYPSNIRLIKHFIFWESGSDSWMPMSKAYEWTKDPGEAPLYEHLFFGLATKFQYPPSSLLIYSLADALGFGYSQDTFNFVSWLCVLLQVGLGVGVTACLLARHGKQETTLLFRLGLMVLAGTMVFSFYPVLHSYYLGQIQTWINAGFMAACLMWLRGHPVGAGVVIGAICLVKPQLALFLIWAALRREWGFVWGFLAMVGSGGILSIWLFGLPNSLDYLNVLSFISTRGEAFIYNQSFNGLLNRMLGNGESMVWNGSQFAPYNPLVYFPTLAFSVVIMALGLLHRLREKQRSLGGFLTAGLAFTIASPVAWDHHYGVMTVIIIALAVDIIMMPSSAAKMVRTIVLGVAYVLLAHQLLPILETVLPTGSVAFSYMFFAGLAVVALLYTIRNPFPVTVAQRQANMDPALEAGAVSQSPSQWEQIRRRRV